MLNSLSRLKLMRLPDRLDRLAEEAAAKGWTCVEFLDHLLEAEAETVIIRIREAGDGKQQEQEQRKA